MNQAAPATKPVLAVACGVLVRDGKVLLAQRPAGKVAAGSWEFPGGKIEPGETTRQALERELHEELGVEVRGARPLIRFRHEYTNRTVLLDTWLIDRFDGEPHGREEQALAWVTAQELAVHPQVLPTVLPIAGALRLPADYVFTPPDADEAFLLQRLAQLPAGALLRLRRPGLDDAAYAVLARRLAPPCTAQGLRLVLDRGAALSVQLGAGWHATSVVLAMLESLPAGLHCHASCHMPQELERAARLGFASAVLGPVRATATHPGMSPLGWERFAEWTAALQLPVYGLGGVGPAQREEAFAAYAQGVAGIRAYW
ncbi:Nudix family hydrolase [Solimonas sp. K1W22B-7]|uniref:Nudix family hydrolase n=1 Tax=Solimonas sp. K1W22B-7 TaxID=2303331 RepID=UPI0013C47AD2|nr:Nudix family hydrolase [Solimonas sp. K1W22B-7]